MILCVDIKSNLFHKLPTLQTIHFSSDHHDVDDDDMVSDDEEDTSEE